MEQCIDINQLHWLRQILGEHLASFMMVQVDLARKVVSVISMKRKIVQPFDVHIIPFFFVTVVKNLVFT